MKESSSIYSCLTNNICGIRFFTPSRRPGGPRSWEAICFLDPTKMCMQCLDGTGSASLQIHFLIWMFAWFTLSMFPFHFIRSPTAFVFLIFLLRYILYKPSFLLHNHSHIIKLPQKSEFSWLCFGLCFWISFPSLMKPKHADSSSKYLCISAFVIFLGNIFSISIVSNRITAAWSAWLRISCFSQYRDFSLLIYISGYFFKSPQMPFYST